MILTERRRKASNDDLMLVENDKVVSVVDWRQLMDGADECANRWIVQGWRTDCYRSTRKLEEEDRPSLYRS